MIELIVIWRLVANIGNSASSKGLKKWPYQTMVVVFWLCGELLGGILSQIILGSHTPFWLDYILALVGAVAGAALAFLIMRLLPDSAPATVTVQPVTEPEVPAPNKWYRSIWIPIAASVLAILCACLAFGGAIFALSVRQMAEQISASNPVFGTELNNDGVIAQPLTIIPETTKTIYFGFDLNMPTKADTNLTFDWYYNGDKLYSTDETVKPGNVVVALGCDELEIASFSPGEYKVQVSMGNYYLMSAQFTVK